MVVVLELDDDCFVGVVSFVSDREVNEARGETFNSYSDSFVTFFVVSTARVGLERMVAVRKKEESSGSSDDWIPFLLFNPPIVGAETISFYY